MRLRIASTAFLALTLTGAAPTPARTDEQMIRQIFSDFSAAVKRKDIDAVMAVYAPGTKLVFFDAFIPRQYTGSGAYRKAYTEFFKGFPGASESIISDMQVTVSGNFAYVTAMDRWIVTDAGDKKTEMVFRCTDVFRKIKGKWLIVHEHLSFPVDPATGMPDFMSKS